MSIQENTFAEACFNMNSIDELKQALSIDADETDMKTWGLTESEYYKEIKLAITALEEDSE